MSSLSEDRSNSFHVVLVEPNDSLNIGSVARAMSNFCFSNLHIVSPTNFIEEKAKATACWGADLIERAAFHESLELALSDMTDVVGFSSSTGKNRSNHIWLPEWLKALEVNRNEKVALLFGPEDTGLRNDHISYCRTLVNIPSNVDNPSLNLAQAALVVCYELSKILSDDKQIGEGVELPTWNEFYQLERMTKNILSLCGYYREGTSPAVEEIVNNLFKRTAPNRREIGILLSLFGRIERTFEKNGIKFEE